MDLCKILIALTATLATSTLAQDEPPRRLNETLKLKQFPNALLASHSFDPLFKRASDSLSCQAGYSLCEGEAVCCPTGNTCCSNGYCTEPGYTCCTTLLGSCPNGWQCCADGGCAPLLGECCAGGLYCPAGKQCRTWKGEQMCCPSSGCSGENDTGESESTHLVATPTISATSVSNSPSATTTTSSVSRDGENPRSHSRISGGAIAGITVGSVAGVLIILALLLRKKLVACFQPRKPAFDFGPGSSPEYVAPSDVSGHTAFPKAGVSEMSEQATVYEVGPSETVSSKPPQHVHELGS